MSMDNLVLHLKRQQQIRTDRAAARATFENQYQKLLDKLKEWLQPIDAKLLLIQEFQNKPTTMQLTFVGFHPDENVTIEFSRNSLSSKGLSEIAATTGDEVMDLLVQIRGSWMGAAVAHFCCTVDSHSDWPWAIVINGDAKRPTTTRPLTQETFADLLWNMI